jgi:hypothetical protein
LVPLLAFHGMKGSHLVIVATTAIASVCPAAAQTASMTMPAAATPRWDIAGSVGWLNVNKSELSDSNDWYNRSAQGALIFGWHWSTHLKTELEVSASTQAEFYAARDQLINAARVFAVSEYHFATKRVTASGQYQFGENAWFHPHVAAGIDANRESIRRFDREVYVYDPAARVPPLVQRPLRHPDVTDTHVRPFVGAGFKGYFTQRGFVRSDLRVVLGKRVEEAAVRFGIGVDF